MEASLPDYQRALCLKALDHLREFSISKMFASPVDPEKDGCPDYFEKVKKPMDLGTARNKLINNEYKTIDDFKADINQIWENTAIYHKKNAIIYYLAQELDSVFQRDMKCVTGNDIESWLAKNEEIKAEMSDTKIVIEVNPNSRPVAKARSIPQSTPTKKAQTIKEEDLMTEADVEALSNDVGYVNKNGTAEHVMELLNLISTCEPEKVKDDGVDAEFSSFKNTTLVSLRKLVDRILSEINV